MKSNEPDALPEALPHARQTMVWLSLVLAVLVPACVLAAILWQGAGRSIPGDAAEPEPRVLYREGAIFIRGRDVTLPEIEKRVRNPALFRYDAERKVFVCNASLDITGTLRLGRPEGGSRTLEIRTFACGDRFIRVRPGGALRLFHSEISTVLRSFDDKLCSKGYAIIGDGEIEFDHSRVLFMSGSRAIPARGGASGRIVDTQFTESDGNSFHAENVDGRKLDIQDCEFISRGNYGVIVTGPGTEPLAFRRCKIRGEAGDVLVAGKDPDVVLIDCDIRKDHLHFNQLNGSIKVQWTVEVLVRDTENRAIHGARVMAISSVTCGESETVQGRTDDFGRVHLRLTEFAASPFNRQKLTGVNDYTPHRIRLLSGEGKELAKEVITADRKGQVVKLVVRER